MMTAQRVILAIDQGTTSSRAILFSEQGQILASKAIEFTQYFPQDGWVEHDPEEIWQTVVSSVSEMVDHAARQSWEILGIGITNQRETAIIWDAETGQPIHRALVWQDRRTADLCARLKQAGHEPDITARTGLLLDPYFSASKIAWMLDNVAGARAAAEAGRLRFGTLDSFLLWRLTSGKVHASDATNASRTSLFNIHSQQWDETLLSLFRVPASLLPEVRDNAGLFGHTHADLFGTELPVLAMIGDQQAAAVGQACFEPGALKSTYGTGCFMIVNTGATPVVSQNRLLTTIGLRLDGQTSYALEGSIFIAGAVSQWLRDGIGLISSAAETEEIAASLPDNQGVYMVPALTGLGAPHWSAHARGAIYGLTRDTGPAHFVRAALESVAYQTADLIAAIEADGVTCGTVRVDGGMAENNWLMQFLADIIDRQVERPEVTETTALGAAMLALLAARGSGNLSELAGTWHLDRAFVPQMAAGQRADLSAGWQLAIDRTLTGLEETGT